MRWQVRRRRIFEGPPRLLYHRTGERYFEACALTILVNGVVVSIFGDIALLLYVNLSIGEVALFAACSALGFAVEGALAAIYFLRAAEPARAWSADGRPDDAAPEAWSTAAQLPLMLVRRPSLYLVGAVGVAAADVLVAALLGRPVYQAALLVPMSYLLYLSSGILRYVGLELSIRPALRDIGRSLPEASPPDPARVSLHERLLATVPMVTWGTALIVAVWSLRTRANSTRSAWPAWLPSPSLRRFPSGSASCSPTRSPGRSSTFATRLTAWAPAISP